MLEYVQKCFRHYVDFSGRARRKEYWFFVLFEILVIFVLMNLLGVFIALDSMGGVILTSVLLVIFALAVLLPGLAVIVRRLHDIDKSGGWYFINFIPFVGFIWFLVLMCKAGTVGENRYGADPKNPEHNETESLTNGAE